MAYKIDKRFQLGANEGSPKLASNYFIVVHETANSKATGENEATFMNRNWRAAYTTHIVGDGKVYLIGEPGYISYGALDANPYAPAQIELQHTLDKELFKKNYAIYIELIRDLCNQFGIPKTLDTSGQWTKGVKSHDWVSKNFSGDHTDPYGYLAKMGISKQQFAKDIANGLGGTAQTAKRDNPQGPWYSEKKRVVVNNKDAHIYSDFKWKFRQNGADVGRKQFNVTGKYEHENGQTYYSLYNDNNGWEGYINKNYTTEVKKESLNVYKEPQGQWFKENKRVMIHAKDSDIYSDFKWKKWKKGIDTACQIFKVTGKYYHQNGFTYYSLYDDKNVWQGYINAGFTSELK